MIHPEQEDDLLTLDFVTVITSVDDPPRLLTKTLTAGPDGKVISGVAPAHPYKVLSVRYPVTGLADLVAVFDRVDRHSCVINGETLPYIDPEQPHRRIKLAKTDKQTGETTPASYGPVFHHWLLIDADGPESDGFGWLHGLGFGELPLEVTALLPPELHGVACHWRLTGSAGVKPGVHIRLAYWLDRALSDEQKLAWLSNYPHCDGSVCDPVQENYIAAPVLVDGVADPLAEYQLERTGMVTGFRSVVAVPEITLPKREHTAVSDDLTEDGQDTGLQQAGKALLGRQRIDGATAFGSRTRAVVRLLGDMRTREGKIFGDADIVALLVEHWPPVAELDLDDITDMVARLGEGRQQPRGCTCIDIEYGYTPDQSTPDQPSPVSYVFGQHFFPGATIPMIPTIYLNGDYLRESTRAAVTAMRDQRLGFFRRGGCIVRPTSSDIAVRGGQTIVGDRLVSIGWQELRHELQNCANFERFDARSEKWKRTNCPADLAQTLYAEADRIELHVLNGVMTAPTMTLDGVILDKPGYDEATGLLYQPSMKFLAMPEKPTKDQAIAALGKLKHLVRSFPFETDADRSVWLSAVLTGAIRRTLPTAPLHMFNAPVAGSGKGLLADTAAIISTGRQASAITQSNDAETEKRLVSMLLAGDPVILIDNVTTALLGDFLCSMLTQTTVNPRKLGVSEAPTLTTNVLMLATGNNIRTFGDMTRRSIRCTINPREENPATRKFDYHPLAEAHRDRGELLTAALTVLRAHIVAGMPKTGVMGSFEDWARIVVGALLWLGEADPITTQAELAEEDPEKAKLGNLLRAWHAAFGSTPITIGAALTSNSNDAFSVFFDAARSVAPDVKGGPGQIDRQKLGNFIGAKKGRIVGGLWFEPGKKLVGAGTWRVMN